MSARHARLLLADRRALEEQAERTNPVPMKGGAKKPRAKKPSLKAAEKMAAPSLHTAMEDEMALMPSGEYEGAGLMGFGRYMSALSGGMLTGKFQGEGAVPSMGLSQFRGGMHCEVESEESEEEMSGGGIVGAGAGAGAEDDIAAAMAGGAKKRRAPAGPNDARRKRAALVKKVMAEKGLSLIDASRYVKAHGLKY